jgi:hypothetical protein
MTMPSEHVRAWVYRCLLAAQPLIVAYGLASSEVSALWVAFAASVLGLGLAAANTSTKTD